MTDAELLAGHDRIATETEAARAFAFLVTHAPAELERVDPFYVAGRGAVRRGYPLRAAEARGRRWEEIRLYALGARFKTYDSETAALADSPRKRARAASPRFAEFGSGPLAARAGSGVRPESQPGAPAAGLSTGSRSGAR